MDRARIGQAYAAIGPEARCLLSSRAEDDLPAFTYCGTKVGLPVHS